MLSDFISNLPALLIALVTHEFAHGYIAFRLGDNTAKNGGRLTLNPLAHVDLFYTIILPILLIISRSPVVLGMAKPVPVDPRNFKDPRKGMLWVSLAGPAANFILSFLIFLVLKSGIPYSRGVAEFLFTLLMINLVIGIFNLIPVPPLDGAGILTGLLPENMARAYAAINPAFGMVFIISLLVLLQMLF